MTNKQLKNFPDIGDYTNVGDNDNVYLSKSPEGVERKLKIIELIRKVLGGRVFGGSGDIVTADSSLQTMGNKRLDTPRINSSTVITVSGQTINSLDGWNGDAGDLNKLAGITTTKNDFENLSGSGGNIQQQINSLHVAPTAKIFTFDTQQTGTPEVVITESELRSHAGLGSSYLVSHRGLLIKVWHKTSSGLYDERDNDNLLPSITVRSKHDAYSLQEMLDKIIIQYKDNQEMIITVHYKVIEKAGV